MQIIKSIVPTEVMKLEMKAQLTYHITLGGGLTYRAAGLRI